MTRRSARLLLALTGAASIAGPLVLVVVNASDGRTLAPGYVPWAAFPLVWWAVGATIVTRGAGHPVGRLLTVVGALAEALWLVSASLSTRTRFRIVP